MTIGTAGMAVVVEEEVAKAVEAECPCVRVDSCLPLDAEDVELVEESEEVEEVDSCFPAAGAAALEGGDLERFDFFSLFSVPLLSDFSLLCSDLEDFLEEDAAEERGVGKASVASVGGAG